MICKPPLYMGPEYIKYFNDKTIDVSMISHHTMNSVTLRGLLVLKTKLHRMGKRTKYSKPGDYLSYKIFLGFLL